MFTPIDRLPSFNPDKQNEYRRRWEIGEGPRLQEKVLEMIRAGAGEDFLQWEYESGSLRGFLEDMWDLRGLQIFQEEFIFSGGDTFEAIDFSHASLYHSTFDNAVFNCAIAFARIHNCTFKRCIFAFNNSYGTTFEQCKFIECEFVETNTFTNCVFRDVSFDRCFIPKRLFFDCSFDSLTRVGEFAPRPFRMNPYAVEPKDLSSILNGIEQAYRYGDNHGKARIYFFRRMQAFTRHNVTTRREKWFGFLKEYLAGYGVRPLRVLGVMAGALLATTVLFSAAVGWADGLILGAGALFTFGARADLLTHLGPGYRFIYVLTAFLGISLTALFVTVLANVWFREG